MKTMITLTPELNRQLVEHIESKINKPGITGMLLRNIEFDTKTFMFNVKVYKPAKAIVDYPNGIINITYQIHFDKLPDKIYDYILDKYIAEPKDEPSEWEIRGFNTFMFNDNIKTEFSFN